MAAVEKSTTEVTKKKRKRKKKSKGQVNGTPAKPEETAVKQEVPATTASKPAAQVKPSPEMKNKKQKLVNGSPTKEKPSTSSGIPKKDQKKQNKPVNTNPGKRKLDDDSANPSQNAKKIKFNKNPNQKKFTARTPSQPSSNELSENRLKAFGINPKKFKNKIKYGGGGDQQKDSKKSQKSFKKPFNKKNVS